MTDKNYRRLHQSLLECDGLQRRQWEKTSQETHMRKIIFTSALLTAGLLLPAVASASTTLEYVVEKGVNVSIQGFEIPVTYNADGTYSATAMGSEIPGTWRIEGTKFCTESSAQPGETCTEYPEGKGPGDSFDVEGAMGPTTVTINE
jgi:hypothetical protein